MASNYYKVKVVSNNGDGTLTVEFPYSSQTMTLRCPPALAETSEEGDQVLVMTDGDAGNSFILCSADIDGFGIDTLTSQNPLMDASSASPGTSNEAARADHVHPSDTSKQDTITVSGIIKGDGTGGISAAEAGVDFQAPLTVADKSKAVTMLAGETRVLTFDTLNPKGGMLVLAGPLTTKQGLYIFSGTSNMANGMQLSAVKAVTQSGMSVTASGAKITIVNGSPNAAYLYIMQWMGNLPTVTDPNAQT